jgi:hypothetical protein
MSHKNWSRRQVLKGAGVALSVPWLETFAPRTAKAQAAAMKKRYISLYFPNGCADFWHPTGAGMGDAWKLSPIWEPLAPLKDKVIATQNLTYQAALQKPNPSHGQLCASMWSCVVADPNPANAKNGTTVDQMIAAAIQPTAKTPLGSLQVGLSTLDSYADGRHGAHSRSISWSSPTQPLYKIVSPQGVFDRLVGPGAQPTGMPMATDPLAERRRALKKSALDYIIESSTSLQGRLGKSDKARLDQFLTSTRNLETRVLAMNMQMAGCNPGTRPTQVYGVPSGSFTNPADYNRGKHADLMTDLVVMGLQCDATRVVSYMLDDARSDYAYTFLQARNFTDTGSTAAGGMVSNGNIADGLAGYHGLQHAGDKNNGFATINYWFAQKAADLALKLKASMEGTTNILDQSVITFGSGMHGGNHEGNDIPVVLIGSGGGVLKQNMFAAFPQTELIGNVHLTIMKNVFGMTNATFPMSTGVISGILA